MKHRALRLCLGVLLLAGCASAANRGSPLYRREIGTASNTDAVTTGTRVIQQYLYEIETQETTPDIRIVTHWRKRPPFDDERALGVSAAESRLVITGRQRGQTQLGTFFTVVMEVENRVQVAGSYDWTETTNTPLFRRYADEISNEYRKLILNIGVRQF